jgi:hypothetical protein
MNSSFIERHFDVLVVLDNKMEILMLFGDWNGKGKTTN